MPLVASVGTAWGWALFAASAVLLAYTSAGIAHRLGGDGRSRSWLALAASIFQIATISTLLSAFHLLAPAPFLLFQLPVAACLRFSQRGSVARESRQPSFAIPKSPTQRGLLFLLGVLLLSAIAFAAVTPINHFDDRAYRASRAAYWLQHQSLMPWDTHNDRQTAFPFGSELMFFWPVLFTRGELAGRLAFAVAIPLCAAGLYSVLRQARATRTAALAGVLLLLTAPAFVYVQEGLFPDLWMTVFVLGAAYFALRANARGRRRALDLVMVGVFTALAVNAKTTALSLLPGVVLVPWLVAGARVRERLRGELLIVAGVVAGALPSGLALVLATNVQRDGHFLGSRGMRQWHAADLSAVQLRTHAARFVVSLIDVPVVPPEPVRGATGAAGNAVLRLFGAAETLPMEGSGSRWPGAYRYGPPIRPSTFSLAGYVWLPALVAAAVLAVRRPDSGARGALILAMLSAWLLVGTVFFVRWMGQSERFRVPAFALGVAVVVLLTQRCVRRWPGLQYPVVALLLVASLPATWDRVRTVQAALHDQLPPRLLDEPFHTPLAYLPAGSRILLVAAQDTRDYGLFRPRDGFVNEVTSWGKSPFDPARMKGLLAEHRITHVLVQNDVELQMEWDPPLRTDEMVRWLSRQPDLVEMPIGSPGMRLFARRALVPSPGMPGEG